MNFFITGPDPARPQRFGNVGAHVAMGATIFTAKPTTLCKLVLSPKKWWIDTGYGNRRLCLRCQRKIATIGAKNK